MAASVSQRPNERSSLPVICNCRENVSKRPHKQPRCDHGLLDRASLQEPTFVDSGPVRFAHTLRLLAKNAVSRRDEPHCKGKVCAARLAVVRMCAIFAMVFGMVLHPP